MKASSKASTAADGGRIYFLCASDDKERTEWIKAIKTHVSVHRQQLQILDLRSKVSELEGQLEKSKLEIASLQKTNTGKAAMVTEVENQRENHSKEFEKMKAGMKERHESEINGIKSSFEGKLTKCQATTAQLERDLQTKEEELVVCYRTCQAKEAEIERLLGAQKQASAEISAQKENEGSQEAMNDEKVKELEEAFETASREHEEALKMMKEAADSAKKHAHDLAEELQRTREDAEREADDLRKKNMEQKMAGKQEQLQMQASRLRLQQELEECRGNVSHLETLNQTLEREKVAAEAGKRAAEEQLLKSSDESFFENNSQLVLKEAKVAMLEQKVKELELVISAKK